jgi:hypothetical protein
MDATVTFGQQVSMTRVPTTMTTALDMVDAIKPETTLVNE